MKRFGILLTLLICMIFISGCNPGTPAITTFTNTAIQTATQTPQDNHVWVNTMLNNETVNNSNTLVLTENTLNISSVLHCTLDGLIGIPIILITDSNGNIVASWYPSEDWNTVTGLGFLQNNNPISSGTSYNMVVTWDLIDMFTNVRVPPGQYILLVTVYSNESKSFLPTNEGSFTLTIN